MEKKFVTYPVAKALKGVGFDEPCFTHFLGGGLFEIAKNFNKNDLFNINLYKNSIIKKPRCTAPLWQDVIEWFMVKHNIYIQESCVFEDTGNRYYFKATIDYGILKGCYVVSSPRLDLTEAREVAILAVIEMLIEKLKTQDSIVPIDVIVKKIPYVEVD